MSYFRLQIEVRVQILAQAALSRRRIPVPIAVRLDGPQSPSEVVWT